MYLSQPYVDAVLHEKHRQVAQLSRRALLLRALAAQNEPAPAPARHQRRRSADPLPARGCA